MIVNAGGVAAVIDYIGETRGNIRLPGIMMLGYVGAHSENLAMAVIVSKVCRFVSCSYVQSIYAHTIAPLSHFMCVLELETLSAFRISVAFFCIIFIQDSSAAMLLWNQGLQHCASP